jgi:hypothetical protein
MIINIFKAVSILILIESTSTAAAFVSAAMFAVLWSAMGT